MFKEQEELYENRIDRFVNRLSQSIYKKEACLEASYFRHEKEVVDYEDRLDGKTSPIKVGQEWGRNFQRAWFHIEGKLPEQLNLKKSLCLVNLGGEGLVYTNQGLPHQSISNHTIWPVSDFKREVIDLNGNFLKDGQVDFWIEATAGQLFGLELQNDHGDLKPKRYGKYSAKVSKLQIASCNQELKNMYYDVLTLKQLMEALPKKSVQRKKLLYNLNKARDLFKSPDMNLQPIREIVQKELSKNSTASSLQTVAVGHAHLDTAWLWPLEETVRKCARTFSNQLRNIEKYDDFVFGASQAQHYAFVKRHYPELYNQIQEQVKKGRWEVQGGMWVEADCNLISGESLIRQILYGKQFFQNEFDIDVNNLWLPDVFGYSAAMPQIIKKTGMDYFVTQKLSWSQFTDFPHHTFIWEGIDGSQVITHFPPEDDYNSELNPPALKKSQENFSENYFMDKYLTLFGIGDGGGGPAEHNLEIGQRCQDLEDLPQVKFDSANNFLKNLDKFEDQLHKWKGELYLELHRGTYTTQAYNKKMNRLMEIRMRELEVLYSLAAGQEYPQKKLKKMWHQLLKNQFHDIIPGSSITPVYEKSRREYEQLSQKYKQLKNELADQNFTRDKDKITFINSLSFPYSNYHALPEDWAGHEIFNQDGEKIEVQTEQGKAIVNLEIAPLSTLVLTRGDKIERKYENNGSQNLILENDLVSYEFNEKAQIIRAYDKELEREIIGKDKPGNDLRLYEDRPNDWDAWDIDIFYENCLLETAKSQKVSIIGQGPIRKGLHFELKIGDSEIIQNIFLPANSKQLDFETEVDWDEEHRLLRVHFPVNVYSEQATYDIQYGNVKRPTHRNTSRDMAKFEVVGHKYADLSDNDYGVALLNNCKYGYKVYGNDLSLSLLRAPTMPDPNADQGQHEFTYSLLPHRNDLINSNVISRAYQLNYGVTQLPGYGEDNFKFPFQLGNQDIIVETIKQSETGEELILRLYEPYGRNATTCLSLNFDKDLKIYEVDMLEREITEIDYSNKKFELNFHPFEIKTLKVCKRK